MFVRFAQTVILTGVAGAATADTCPSFGFEAPYLSEFFCKQLGDVAGPTTRTIDGGDPAATRWADGPGAEWLELPIVQEAWRSDPAKTLRLIERIREAGGGPRQ